MSSSKVKKYYFTIGHLNMWHIGMIEITKEMMDKLMWVNRYPPNYFHIEE